MRVRTSRTAEPVVEEGRGRTPRVECRPVSSATELAAHYAVRHRVFVEEQGVFPAGDRDVHDDEPGAGHVVGLVNGVVCGTVRLYPLDRATGVWQGDRLAVLGDHRRHGLGAPLVRLAVRLAGQCRGREMIAHVQPDNVRFFEYLGWHQVGGIEDYVGIPHQRMSIMLDGATAPEDPSPTPR